MREREKWIGGLSNDRQVKVRRGGKARLGVASIPPALARRVLRDPIKYRTRYEDPEAERKRTQKGVAGFGGDPKSLFGAQAFTSTHAIPLWIWLPLAAC